MRIKSLITASTISTLLLTLLTPFIANGQFVDNPETDAVTGVAMQSCAGIGKPLSKAEISNRSSSSEPITTVFENFALRSVGVPPNKNPTRRFSVYELGLSVEPDGIEPLKLLAIKPDGTVVRNQDFADSIFYDAKARTSKIAISDLQTQGYIFYLGRVSPAGTDKAPLKVRPTPRLVYLTVSDTKIGPTVSAAGLRERVAIYQSVVCDNPTGIANQTDTIMGKPILLNPAVYTGRPQPSVPIYSIPSTLR